MQFGEIFSDSLKYPLSDYAKWLIVGVIVLICGLDRVLIQFGIFNSTLNLILHIVSLLASILLLGYGLSVIKNGIELNEGLPDFDWTKNFVDGIKYAIVTFVYYIIPAIITTIVAFITGYGPLSKILTESNLQKFMALNGTVTQADILNIVPEEVWASLFTAIAITAIVALILFIIFAIFQYIAVCRLAKYESLGEAFSFKEVYSDIREIGILKILGFIIVAFIISSIIGAVFSLVAAIPFVGIIIAPVVGYSFIALFNDRALGLLYSDV